MDADGNPIVNSQPSNPQPTPQTQPQYTQQWSEAQYTEQWADTPAPTQIWSDVTETQQWVDVVKTKEWQALQNTKAWESLAQQEAQSWLDPSVFEYPSGEVSFDTPPVVENGRTLVPIRTILDLVGRLVSIPHTLNNGIFFL